MPITTSILAVIPFITPWLFYVGAAAVSIPIIIHLLNKRRFRVVVWAAMDFLLAAQRRNARRLKFQRWLLLALRCAALLIIAAAIAQFILPSTALGTFLGSGQRATVFIIDDSASMAYQQPGQPNHFDRAKKLVLASLDAAAPSDRMAVLRASRGSLAVVSTPSLDHKSVKTAVNNMEVTDAGTDLSNAFDQTLATLKEAERLARTCQVVLLTDLTRSSLPADNAAGEKLRKTVEEVKKKASLRIVDLGQDNQSNRAIVALSPVRPTIVAGQPVELEVAVMNASAAPQLDTVVTVFLDGIQAGQEKLPRIEPGATRSATVAVTIPAPGRHVLEARLVSNDLFPLDDTRRLVLEVKRELPLLVVDGNPGDNRTLGSTTFLQLAYAPLIDGKPASIFTTKNISQIELPRTTLNPYAAVILSDLGPLDPTTLTALKNYVDAGGLLLLFPGNRTNSTELERTLGSGGVKLLPATPGQIVQLQSSGAAALKPDAVAGVQFDPAGYSHPVLRVFGDAVKAGQTVGLTTATTHQYLKLTVPADGSSDTILKFTDQNPAVVARQVGRGRVILFATTADTTWTSFPAKPSYVPFLWELLYYGMSRDNWGLTLNLGQRLHLPADAAPAGSWSAPHNGKLQVTTTVESDGRAFITSTPLVHAGLYGPANQPPVIGVNPDVEEADLRHLKPAEMAQALNVDREDILVQPATLSLAAQTSSSTSTTAGTIGHNLLLVALGLLLAETLLARLFSSYK